MVLTASSYKVLQKGSRAPSFSLSGIDGKMHSLLDYKDKKAILIIFMCNHCPYVQPKVPYFVELQSAYGPQGLQIMGISATDTAQVPEDSLDHMKIFAEQNKINFPYLYDASQSVPKKYGATCTPDPFLFNSNFELVYHGRVDDAHKEPHEKAKKSDLEQAIQETLSNKPVTVTTSPSFGCNIKWKSGNEPEYWDQPR